MQPLRLRHAGTFVADGDRRVAVVAHRAQMNRRIRRILERVFDDVPERFAEFGAIADDASDALDAIVDLARLVEPARSIALAAQQFGEIDCFGIAAASRESSRARRISRSIRPRMCSFSIDIVAENLSRDRRLGDGAAAKHVDVAADDRQRRAQLVPGVGNELAHALLGLAPFVHRARDACGGIVVGGGQRADFVAALQMKRRCVKSPPASAFSDSVKSLIGRND